MESKIQVKVGEENRRSLSDNLFELAKAIATPIPDSAYDNGLNFRCKVCNAWVSKRFFPTHHKAKLCPNHYHN